MPAATLPPSLGPPAPSRPAPLFKPTKIQTGSGGGPEEEADRAGAGMAGAAGAAAGGPASPRVPLRERSREDLLRLLGEGARKVKVLQGRLEEAEGARADAEGRAGALEAELEEARAQGTAPEGGLETALREAQLRGRAEGEAEGAAALAEAQAEARRLRESEEALSSELSRRLEASAAQERRVQELAAEKDALEAALEAGAERAEAAEAQLDASLEELDRLLAEGAAAGRGEGGGEGSVPGDRLLLQKLQQTVEETRGETAALRLRRGWDSPLSSPRLPASPAGDWPSQSFRRSVSLGPRPDAAASPRGPGLGTDQAAELQRLRAEKSDQAATIEELKGQVEALLGAGDVRDVVRLMQAAGPAKGERSAEAEVTPGSPEEGEGGSGGEGDSTEPARLREEGLPPPPTAASVRESDIPPEYLKNVVVKLLETGRWAELLPAVASMLDLTSEEVARLEAAYRERDAPLEAARAAVEAGQGLVAQGLGAAGAAAGALYGVFDRGAAAAAAGAVAQHGALAPSSTGFALGSLFAPAREREAPASGVPATTAGPAQL